MKLFKIFSLQLIVLTVISCKDSKENIITQTKAVEHQDLSSIITYQDSIGDVSESITLMKLKIDSLYNEIIKDAIYLDSLKVVDINSVDKIIANSKASHITLIESNMEIIDITNGSGTIRESMLLLSEYYYLSEQFKSTLLLQRDFHDYREAVETSVL